MSKVVTITSSVFYGYPAELIARWCLVSPKTAAQWKRGEKRPSPQALRLFELYSRQQVLGPEWAGWIVKGDRLVTPENEETTQGQLRAYVLIYQLARELMRDDPAARERFEEIVSQAV